MSFTFTELTSESYFFPSFSLCLLTPTIYHALYKIQNIYFRN